MKKFVVLSAILLNLALKTQVHATPYTYNFNPYDSGGTRSDIEDLDHTRFYVWEINNFSLAADVRITGATLTFKDIYDWRSEPNDALYIHLMNSTPSMSLTLVKSRNTVDADLSSGVKTYNTRLFQGIDNEKGGDNFTGMGTMITPVWSDPLGGMPPNTLVYNFALLGGSVNASGNIVNGSVNILSTLETYLRNGNNFSFGFDPDCHYYNNGVTFTITTDNVQVPEPGIIILLGTGSLLGAAFLRKRS